MKVRFRKDAELKLKLNTKSGITKCLIKKLESMDIDAKDWPDFREFCFHDKLGWEPIRKETLHIYVPDGIGDIHWVFMKLEGLMHLSGATNVVLYRRTIPKALDYFNRTNRSDDFIMLNPNISNLIKDSRIIEVPRSGVLTNALGLDYILNPCPVLESGKRLEQWMPNIPINYNYKMNWPELPSKSGIENAEYFGNPVVYFGSRYAEVTWGGKWTDAHWSKIVEYLGFKFNKVPVVLGLEDDLEKAKGVESRGCAFINLIGSTVFEDAFHLIKNAPIFVAAVGGLSIVMSSLGCKVLELWPDSKSLQQLPDTMRGSWLLNNTNYVGLGYSSDLELVINKIEELLER